jgi:ketosteroid isomerase-like protein
LEGSIVQEPKLVVEALDRAVETGDVAALDSICHPDIITHSLSASMPQGIEGIRRFVANRTATGAAGHWDEVVTVAEGEYVVQFGTRSFYWPGGPFRGFDVPKGPTRRDCAFMFRVRDGLITDRWAIRDDLVMMTQLGTVTAPRPNEVTDGTITSKRERPFE